MGVGGSKQFGINLHLNLDRTKMNKLIDEAVNNPTISDSTKATVNSNAMNSSSNSMSSFQDQNGIEVLDLDGASKTQANTNMQTGSVQGVDASKAPTSQNVDSLQSVDTKSSNSSPGNLEGSSLLSENSVHPENRESASSNNTSVNGNNNISSSQVEQQRTSTTNTSTSTRGMTNNMSSTSSASNPEGANASSRVGNSLNGQETMSFNPATSGAAMGRSSQKDVKEGRVPFKKNETNPASRFQNGTTVAEQYMALNLDVSKQEIEFNNKVVRYEMELKENKKFFEESKKRVEEDIKKIEDEIANMSPKAADEIAALGEAKSEEIWDRLAKEQGYESWEAMQQKLKELKAVKIEAEAYIYQIDEQIKTGRYDLLKEEAVYQSYQSNYSQMSEIEKKEMINSSLYKYEHQLAKASYTQCLKKGYAVSPLEFIESYMAEYPYGGPKGVGLSDSGLEVETIELLKNLSEASQIDADLGKTYNYLYETKGIEAATQYLYDITDKVNQTLGEEKAKEFLESLQNDPKGMEKLENHLKVTGTGLKNGVENFWNGMMELIHTHKTLTVDQYESSYILQALSEGNYSIGAGANYKYSQAIGNMLPSMVLSMFTPLLGSASLGLSSGGHAYSEAKMEGYGLTKSILYGMLVGGSDAMLEYFLGSIPGLSKLDDSTNFLIKMAKEGGQEAVQEVFTSGIVDSILLGKEITLGELTVDSLESFIDGAVVAGILNGAQEVPQQAINVVMNGEKVAIPIDKIKDFLSNIDRANLKQELSDFLEYMGQRSAVTLSSNGVGMFNAMLDYFKNKKQDADFIHNEKIKDNVNSDEELELAFFDNFKKKKATSNFPSNPVINVSNRGMQYVNQINDYISEYGGCIVTFNSTSEISSAMLSQITDLSKLQIKILDGLGDGAGNLKAKYLNSGNPQKYVNRVTYTGLEMNEIVKEVETIESMINKNASDYEKAKQAYEIIASRIPVMHDFRQYENGHLVSASLRGVTDYNVVGKKGLVCAGYASLYSEVCKRIGIDCEYIKGKGYSDPLRSGTFGGHAWNVLKINGELIPVDVCWKACDESQNWFGPSEEFQGRHEADPDEQYNVYNIPLSEGVQGREEVNRGAQDIYNTPLLSQTILEATKTTTDYYDTAQAVGALKEYVKSGNATKFTRKDGARAKIENLDPVRVKQYFETMYNSISTAINIHNNKYPNQGNMAFEKFLSDGNYNHFTATGGARDLVKGYSLDELKLLYNLCK